MTEKRREIYYHDYEGLDQLLNCQARESERHGKPAHDEMLFIVVHQAYELWFKQIIFELNAACEIFTQNPIPEKDMGRAVAFLARIIEIQKVLLQQLHVLETMTPLDFLEFRDYLIPASGFQSWQFRIIENRLGMLPEKRLSLGDKTYVASLRPAELQRIEQAAKQPSLLRLIERWLERIPFLENPSFDFWKEFRGVTSKMLASDRAIIENNSLLSDKTRAMELKRWEGTQQHFESLFDEQKHRALVEAGQRVLSYRATQAALFICLYRDEPILQLPFHLLTALMDIDENFTAWRYRHMLMVRRMIGEKIGTGGSSGTDYLRQGAEMLRIFGDLFNLSTFFVPRSQLPALPAEFRRHLDFSYAKR